MPQRAPYPWEKNMMAASKEAAVPGGAAPAPAARPAAKPAQQTTLDLFSSNAAPAVSAPEPDLVPLDAYGAAAGEYASVDEGGSAQAYVPADYVPTQTAAPADYAPARPAAPALPKVDIDSLNPAQREAVVTTEGPLLVLAGAGSGKTRVLTARIAYMIEQGVAPFNILALTFTNKAAQQMRERIAQMIPDNRSRYIRMGTFHSVFSRILRENAEKIGFPESFTIYEPSDCKNLIKTIVRELNLADEKYKPNLIASRISYAKNCLVTPGAYLANSVYAAEDRQAQIPEFGNVYISTASAASATARWTSTTCSCRPTSCCATPRTCWRATRSCSNTSWWTSTRTPTACSTSSSTP